MLQKTNCNVDVVGIDQYDRLNTVCLTGGVVKTNKGDTTAIMHEYAGFGTGLIYSSMQMEECGISVDEKSMMARETLSENTPEWYLIPLDIKNGLTNGSIRPFSYTQWEHFQILY